MFLFPARTGRNDWRGKGWQTPGHISVCTGVARVDYRAMIIVGIQVPRQNKLFLIAQARGCLPFDFAWTRQATAMTPEWDDGNNNQ